MREGDFHREEENEVFGPESAVCFVRFCMDDTQARKTEYF